jgi:hypothetical protein
MTVSPKRTVRREGELAIGAALGASTGAAPDAAGCNLSTCGTPATLGVLIAK